MRPLTARKTQARHAAPRRLNVWVRSLGCPRNRADTEDLLGALGLPLNTRSSPGNADLIFINTCAFIEPAARESLQAIFDAASHLANRRRRPLLAVAGCLPGRYGTEELRREIPEVDLWLDVKSRRQWPQLLAKALRLSPQAPAGRLISSPSHFWLKIADGCRHHCAFCTIPSIRGKLASEPATAILEQARQALARGVPELDLIAQDTTAWGEDLDPGQKIRSLPELVRALAELPGLAWLRMLYLHPASITPDLLDALGMGAPVLPYLDIPFQHSEKSVLERMGRPAPIAAPDLVERIRARLSGCALRATLMVGFPGETEADFRKLVDFVRQARFHHLGVFTFEPEEGTRAASMPDQVPREVASERRAELMAMQAQISREILDEYAGRRMDVLVDEEKGGEWPGLHAGRVWFQAPEVDGIAYISGEGVAPGKMVSAEIVDTHTYDLSALAQPQI